MKPDFNAAARPLVLKEGPWSHDAGDDGKKTVYGVSEVFQPDSPVWPLVKALEARGLQGAALSTAIQADLRILQAALVTFRVRFWDALSLDYMPTHGLAVRLLDMGVNLGVPFTALYLQASLNCLNRQGTLFAELALKGGVGPLTVAAVRAVCSRANGSLALWKLLNGFNATHLVCGKDLMRELLRQLEACPPPSRREDFTWGLVINRTYDKSELETLT